MFKNHKQLTQYKHYIAQTNKVQKNSSSKLNKAYSHEMQISLANLNYTLEDV